MYSVLKLYVLAHKFAKVINRGQMSPLARKEFNITDKILIFSKSVGCVILKTLICYRLVILVFIFIVGFMTNFKSTF